MDLLWIMDSWLWLRSWVRVGFGNLYQRNTYQYTEQNVLAPWLTGEYNWFPPKGAILKERMPSIISRTDVKELMPSMKNKQRVGWLKERKLETEYPSKKEDREESQRLNGERLTLNYRRDCSQWCRECITPLEDKLDWHGVTIGVEDTRKEQKRKFD